MLCSNTGIEARPCDKLRESEHQASQQRLAWEPSSSERGLFGFCCCYQLGSLQKRRPGCRTHGAEVFSASLSTGCKENEAAFLERAAVQCESWLAQRSRLLWGWGHCAPRNPGARPAKGRAGSQPVPSLRRWKGLCLRICSRSSPVPLSSPADQSLWLQQAGAALSPEAAFPSAGTY